MNQQDNKNICMACQCPCEMHKEHNHPVSAEGGSASGREVKTEELGKEENDKSKKIKSCSACGMEHKPDGTPTCGCN